MIRSTYNSRRVFPMFNVKSFKDVSSKDIGELIVKSGLDWEVVKEQCHTQDGKPIDGMYYLKRADNGVVLSGVGPQWTAVQNKEKWAFFQPYLDSDLFEVAGAGSFNEGREVAILARVKLPDVEIVKGDPVGFYVYLADTFGARCLRGSAVVIRLACANGAIRQDVVGAFKFRHSKQVGIKLESVQNTLSELSSEFTKIATDYKRMASRQLTSVEELRGYIENVLEVKRKEDGSLSTRARNTIDSLVNHVEGTELVRANLVDSILSSNDSEYQKGAGRNYWQAYNAVTDYLNHSYGHNEESRLDALLHGQSAKTEQRAYELALGENILVSAS
jgi:phage/plasmid-like protein (TIGR03299 family)